MSDPMKADGRLVRGDSHDALHPDDPTLADWLRKVLKPEAFQGDAVVLPRDAMDGLVDMCRRKGFVIDAG